MSNSKVWEASGIQIPISGWSYSFVSVNNKLYSLGGMNQGSYFSNVYVYDFTTEAWTEKQPLIGSNRMGVVSVHLNGKIYALGGVTSSGALSNEFAEYDIDTDTWTPKENIHSICQPSLISLEDAIYICGGIDNYSGWKAHSYSKALYLYHVKTGIMEQKADMPIGMFGAPNMCFCNGKIFCFGEKFDGTAICQKYDVAQNRWEIVEDMPPRDETRLVFAAQFENYAYLISKKTYRFSLEDDSWTEIEAGPLLNTAPPSACAVVDHKIYVGGDFTNKTKEIFVLNPSEPANLHIFLKVNESVNLVGMILPEGIEADDLIWSSDATEIASIAQDGILTGMAPGTCTISVRTTDGNFEAAVMVWVTDDINDGLKISISLHPNEKCRLKAGFKGKIGKATWESSEPSIASIDRYGLVTALAKGITIMTMTNEEGKKEYIYVLVKKALKQTNLLKAPLMESR